MQEIHYKDMKFNPFNLIGDEWMLVTAVASWISRSTIHPVVGTIHYKLHPLGNSTELTDNKFVTDKVVEMRDVLLKLVSTIHIIIVGVIADDDTRILHHILDVAESW